MKKRKSHAFGKDVYLLGKNEYGELIWLEEASFDCRWYWGFGYVEVYTNQKFPNKAKDISSHSHFSGLTNKDLILCVVEGEEKQRLFQLMKRFYYLKEIAEKFHLNSAYKCDLNKARRTRINEVLLPQIFKEVYSLLSPSK